jgi:hypothetical protein
MDQMIFRFPIIGSTERLLNFFHMGDFFVVSGQVKELFVHRFPDELEITPIRVLHENGDPASHSYFAARLNRVIDCIDPGKSTRREVLSKETIHSFADGLVRYDLDERCWDEFSNDGPGKYTSYRSMYEAERVHLIDGMIPTGTLLFQPKYWPGHWIIEIALRAS